jgi:hypothetical protein
VITTTALQVVVLGTLVVLSRRPSGSLAVAIVASRLLAGYLVVAAISPLDWPHGTPRCSAPATLVVGAAVAVEPARQPYPPEGHRIPSRPIWRVVVGLHSRSRAAPTPVHYGVM